MGNRPDCAYFLLLSLCGAAFLLTIGGILTYSAFNPDSTTKPQNPHFIHHPHPNSKNQSQSQTLLTKTSQNNPSLLIPTHIQFPYNNETENDETQHEIQEEKINTQGSNKSNSGESQSLQTLKQHNQGPLSKENSHQTGGNENPENETPGGHPKLTLAPTLQSGLELVRENKSVDSSGSHEEKAKESYSLVLVIIGPLCLLMGSLVILIVAVLALKYDCDHEPEPDITFLRLRSEMSLNFDPDKNNYELLRHVRTIQPSSSADNK